MQDIWNRIETWLKANAPTLLETLQPGASDAQIQELEADLGVRLPEDFRASYRIHDGQAICSDGLLNAREFLCLERIRDEWVVWKELLDGGDFSDEQGQDFGSDPDPGIRNVWWSDQWIPLTYDGAGNHDCLDLSPAEGGNVGQIISMWHDSDGRELLAPNFRAWLQNYADQLESGQLVYSEEYGGILNI